jgi:hypothetical protein
VRVTGVQPIEDSVQDTIAFRQDLAVVETQDLESMGIQRSGPTSVYIRRGSFVVLPAIQLDDQSRFDTGKVSEERADRVLTPELVAAESAIAQVTPQQTLGIGRDGA